MIEWKFYRVGEFKLQARRYVKGEDLTCVKVHELQRPEKDIGYIGRNSKSMWYIDRSVFERWATEYIISFNALIMKSNIKLEDGTKIEIIKEPDDPLCLEAALDGGTEQLGPLCLQVTIAGDKKGGYFLVYRGDEYKAWEMLSEMTTIFQQSRLQKEE